MTSTATPDQLKAIFRAAAEQISKPGGWCQGADHKDGAACLRGALQDQAGEHYNAAMTSLALTIKRAVVAWNDETGRTVEEVAAALIAAPGATDFAGANLTWANLAGAVLTGANLTDAYLAGANLARANLTGAKADKWTVWPAGFDAAAAGVVTL